MIFCGWCAKEIADGGLITPITAGEKYRFPGDMDFTEFCSPECVWEFMKKRNDHVK